MNIQMVDLKGQYEKIKPEIDEAIQNVIDSTRFIGGAEVDGFAQDLASYLNVKHVIPCANGTDALQLALMALDLPVGAEIIVPAFTYVATAEVIALLGLTPIMVEADERSFNIDVEDIKAKITPRTKAVVPVHLFGQCSDMEDIMQIAKEHDLYVIEDNAQAIGAEYTFADGTQQKAGTIGHIGTTSFFPSKNLGCYGDGGAIMTNDDNLYLRLKMIANHGQQKKYHHQIVGVNSRLDAIQAAILRVKLLHLDEYCDHRRKCAAMYSENLVGLGAVVTPHESSFSTHVYHQYTLQVKEGKRDDLKAYLKSQGIPSMIYYPLPLYKQKAYEDYYHGDSLSVTERHCEQVLSLPIDTEINEETINYVTSSISSYFN